MQFFRDCTSVRRWYWKQLPSNSNVHMYFCRRLIKIENWKSKIYNLSNEARRLIKQFWGRRRPWSQQTIETRLMQYRLVIQINFLLVIQANKCVGVIPVKKSLATFIQQFSVIVFDFIHSKISNSSFVSTLFQKI